MVMDFWGQLTMNDDRRGGFGTRNERVLRSSAGPNGFCGARFCNRLVVLLSISIVLHFSLGTGNAQTGGAEDEGTAPATQGPRIEFSEPVYDFGTVEAGAVIEHDYIFKNVGEAVLEIPTVKPSCGCTPTGEWDKRVEPGMTGRIPLKFNTANYGGKVVKSVKVTCNDPIEPTITLQLKGTIWQPIEVSPSRAYFSVLAEDPARETRVIRIVNNMDDPLELLDPECDSSVFEVELSNNRPGQEYELRVTVLPPLPRAHVQGQVKIKTSSEKVPVLTIPAYASVRPVVQVIPSRFTLPQAASDGAREAAVTVTNSGRDALELSEAAIDLEGAEVHVMEVIPGRQFKVELSLENGIEIGADQLVLVTLKSNHADYPEIKIPVVQGQVARPGVAVSAKSDVGAGRSLPVVIRRVKVPRVRD
jgi:hypothetical protein